MEFLILLVLIAGGLYAVWKYNQFKSRQQENSAKPQSAKPTYRPIKSARSNSSIVFKPPRSAHRQTRDLASLHDAFTGAPLDAALGLYQCTNCTVYYHAQSVEILNTENGSRCVACGSASVGAVTPTRRARGTDYRPNLVTLANLNQHFGRVVTFEGIAVSVRTSRKGDALAVMFENKPWRQGFKLVVFKNRFSTVGGEAAIKNLAGKRLSVRGLVSNHLIHGPQIIVAERSMILEIK